MQNNPGCQAKVALRACRAKAEDPSGQSSAHMAKSLVLAMASGLDPVFLPQILLLPRRLVVPSKYWRATFDSDRYAMRCTIGILDFFGVPLVARVACGVV